MSEIRSGFRFRGVIRVNPKGFGFITPEKESGLSQDVYVAPEDVKGALSGDTVFAEITRYIKERPYGNKRHSGEKAEKCEARVLKIEEKAAHIYSGVVYEKKNMLFVEANGLRYSGNIRLSGDTTAVEPNDIIVFELKKLPDTGASRGIDPDGEARVLQVIGKDGEAGADISAIVAARGIRSEFPYEVINESESLPSELSEEEIQAEIKRGRRDLRDLRIVTIDSAETKDVDDGVSIELNEQGNYVLGVHIADVTHYVKENSALDKEAQLRGTSVYLADRVIPMLPRKLSNGICSLNVGVDRFALTVMMEINGEGTVLSHQIFESVIRVQYKITYEQLYKLLDEGDTDLKTKYKPYVRDLGMMRILAGILRRNRTAGGSIDFYFPETRVKLDGEGRAIKVGEYTLTFANNIIEEFMLICNQTVAETYYWQNVPFMYRVHEPPSNDRTEEFSRILQNLGFRLKTNKSGEATPKDYQNLMFEAEGHPFSAVISLLALRSMSKAAYMGENRGHFGLAFDFYTHFTSPIRRYPDLFIHRVIKYIIAKKLDNEKEKELRELIPDLAKACSSAERNAEEAERESTDLKVTEYMSNYIGEIFKGVVSGVTSFGIFVRLPNSAEGLMRYENIPNDYFEYNPDRLQAKSQMTGKTIKIGDEMEVLVAACDVPMRKIEFAPVDNFTKKHGVRLKTSVVESRDAIPGRVRNAAKKGSKPPRNRYERRKSSKRSGKRSKK